MMNNRILKSISVFLFIFSSFMVTSCQTSVVPGSERVRVFDAEPKGCLYIGEISSVQKSKTVGVLETEMTLDTRVDLRNKAHKLGGNILVFLKGKNTNTLPGTKLANIAAIEKPGVAEKSASGGKSDASPTVSTPVQESSTDPGTLVFLATVFKCPSSVLNQ